MTCDSFEWSVELPEKGTQTSWGSRPKARVVFGSDGASEHWSVPVSVGRKLKSARDKSGFDPSCRSELACKVKELSLSCGTRRIESLLNKRDYSSKELFDKLRRDGYSEEASNELVARAVNSNLVNDERFASVYVRSKCFAGWGRRKIERELSHKGVDFEKLPGWPEEYFEDDDEAERALDLARRRRLTGKNDFQKIVRFLCSKGYAMNVAFDAARTVVDESGEVKAV